MTEKAIAIDAAIKPPLDSGFVPAVLWNRAFRARTEACGAAEPLSLVLERGDGTATRYDTQILPKSDPAAAALNERYVERLLKLLLWQRGGCTVRVVGSAELASGLARRYAPDGERRFDYEVMGEKIYGKPMTVVHADEAASSGEAASGKRLGRHLEGCRIGFDLGGSDRKCAAVIDGEVVHSEEVAWDPYFEKDPQYHYDGITDTLRRAAAKLPRVDAIGGSAAGVYVNNEVRIASLFRGVPADLFDRKVRGLFLALQKEWGGVPFEVVNDGEVTALAGSMSMGANAILGVSMGTSQAGGYVRPDGTITDWLNELAFMPVDYRPDAPVDEWSGDAGCGVQYFSQQAVGRLCPAAGIELPADMKLPEKLVEVQRLMDAGDERAARIYETIGVYFGYAIAHYADFYEIRNLLILGRVTSGPGGDVIIARASEVLAAEFPELHGQIAMRVPGETDKRHGQAVAAASLPELKK